MIDEDSDREGDGAWPAVAALIYALVFLLVALVWGRSSGSIT
jgi:hypothetical protein